MTLQLNVGGTPRDLTGPEQAQVALGLGLSRGWSNNHGFYSPLDTGIDFMVWPGFALSSSGSARGGASLGAGTAYIGGTRVRYAGGAVATSATMDHYLDVDIDGVLTVGVVGVGVAPPARPPNSIRVARYTTNATQIASVGQGFLDLAGNWVGNYISAPYARSARGSITLGAGTVALSFGASTTQMDNAAVHSEVSLAERFYAPSPGLYSVSAGVKLATGQASQAVSIAILRDGSDVSLAGDAGDPSTKLALGASVLVEAGPLAYFSLAVTNAASLNVSNAYLSIAKVA